MKTSPCLILSIKKTDLIKTRIKIFHVCRLVQKVVTSLATIIDPDRLS